MNFFAWAFLSANALAQTCLHTNLSNKFDYKIDVTKSLDSGHVSYSKVILSVYNKKNKKLMQKINVGNINSNLLYDAFQNCKNVRSYITGYNEDKIPSDYDYGDFVVADLNFDGKEDFVINGGYSADAGPNYIFYFQDTQGHFRISHFLTDRMGSFPTHLNIEKKTLVHTYILGKYQGEKTFKYNAQTKKWRLAKWTEKKIY